MTKITKRVLLIDLKMPWAKRGCIDEMERIECSN